MQASGNGEDVTIPSATPRAVHERRDRLLDAMRALDQAAASPSGEADVWRRHLLASVKSLAATLDAHVMETEASGGFFDQLLSQTSGRLRASVQRLRRDHERLVELTQELEVRAEHEPRRNRLHAATRDLLEQLDEHRRVGADLLWDAYGMDLGLQD